MRVYVLLYHDQDDGPSIAVLRNYPDAFNQAQKIMNIEDQESESDWQPSLDISRWQSTYNDYITITKVKVQ